MYNYYGAPFGGFPPAPGAAMPPAPGLGFAPPVAPPPAPTMAPTLPLAPWNLFWNPYWYASAVGLGWGLGGERRWGGTYSPQFLLTGLPTDDEIEEMVYDSIDADPLIPFDADITVTSDAGVVTLTGTVPTKTVKHAAGDDAWWIPGVDDVRNELQVERRRARREEEAAPSPPMRAAAGGSRRVRG